MEGVERGGWNEEGGMGGTEWGRVWMQGEVEEEGRDKGLRCRQGEGNEMECGGVEVLFPLPPPHPPPVQI